MRVSLALRFALIGWLVAAVAGAQVRQPDGTIVPQPSDGAPSLQEYLDRRMEVGLDVRRDAAVTPERFTPGCSIRFTVVARDSGYDNSFGWYNVVPGSAPAASDLHELVGPTAPEGFTATLDFRSNPAWRGGEIGFYLRTPPPYVYYSERAYQPDRDVSMGFVHLLIYDSRATPNAFYFAWEDLYNGGDNDFQDLLMIVDNLVCAGGGDRCDTGEPGVCAQGVRQCRSGALACVRSTGPSAERCDGLDNDCDGMVDDGDGLCGARLICDRGVCLDRCTQELGCGPGFACSDRGTCVEDACASVTCPEGRVCRAGMCREPCEGVTCPHGQICRVGRCVDPCAGLTCEGDQVCVAGVCQTRCPCRRCGAGESCFTDGRCRPMACATVTCPAGSYCEAGACRDACVGAVCPNGGACRLGVCQEPVVMDAGVRADAGLPPRDSGVPSLDAGAVDGALDSGTLDASRDVGGAEVELVVDDPGANCVCSAPGAMTKGGRAWGLLALAAGLSLRRTRRRGRAAQP
jgi:hypothetical protein